MEDSMTLRKVDGEVVVVTVSETTSQIDEAEYDRQIEQHEAIIEKLKSDKEKIIAFKESDDEEATV